MSTAYCLLSTSTFHSLFHRAAQRNRSAGTTPLTFAADHVLGLLGNILLGGNAAFNPYHGVRKWGSRGPKKLHTQELSSVASSKGASTVPTAELRSTLTLPAVEVVLAKASVPHPCLSLHIQGLALSVPMTDETMCHLSAIALAHIMPFYC